MWVPCDTTAQHNRMYILWENNVLKLTASCPCCRPSRYRRHSGCTRPRRSSSRTGMRPGCSGFHTTCQRTGIGEKGNYKNKCQMNAFANTFLTKIHWHLTLILSIKTSRTRHSLFQSRVAASDAGACDRMLGWSRWIDCLYAISSKILLHLPFGWNYLQRIQSFILTNVWFTSLIAKTLGSMSIGYRSYAKVSDRYQIDIGPRAFAILDVFSKSGPGNVHSVRTHNLKINVKRSLSSACFEQFCIVILDNLLSHPH